MRRKKIKLSNSSHRITSPLHIHESKEKEEGPLSRTPVSSAISRMQTYSQHVFTPSSGAGERDTKVGILTGKSRPVQECSAINVQPQVAKIETEPAVPETLLTIKKDLDTSSEKFIPRLIDSPPCVTEVDPQGWSVEDVSKFLMLNDCGSHCDSFTRNVSDMCQTMEY